MTCAAIELGIHEADVVQWFGRPDESAMEILARNRRRWADGSPTFSICGMDGLCVGHAWINISASDKSIGFVGYWLLPGSRGHGFASRTVRLLSDWAVRDSTVTRLRLLIEPANQRSHAAAERAGYRQIGIIAGNDTIDWRVVDHVLFELSPALLGIAPSPSKRHVSGPV